MIERTYTFNQFIIKVEYFKYYLIVIYYCFIYILG